MFLSLPGKTPSSINQEHLTTRWPGTEYRLNTIPAKGACHATDKVVRYPADGEGFRCYVPDFLSRIRDSIRRDWCLGGSSVREARGSTYVVIDFPSSSLRGYGCRFCGVRLFGLQLGCCEDRWGRSRAAIAPHLRFHISKLIYAVQTIPRDPENRRIGWPNWLIVAPMSHPLLHVLHKPP